MSVWYVDVTSTSHSIQSNPRQVGWVEKLKSWYIILGIKLIQILMCRVHFTQIYNSIVGELKLI